MQALAASLRVGFCVECKRAFTERLRKIVRDVKQVRFVWNLGHATRNKDAEAAELKTPPASSPRTRKTK